MKKLSDLNDPILACLENAQNEKSRLLDRAAHLSSEFRLFCVSHGLTPTSNRPTRILGYSQKVRMHRMGAWAGAILATCVFAALNVLSLEGPLVLIIGASLVFAILVGFVAHSTVAQIAKVDILDLRSTKRAERLHVSGGLAAISSLGVFLYLRFGASAYTGTILAIISLIFELGTACFVSASWELKSVYDSERFEKAFDESQLEIQMLDAKIAACLRQLKEEDHSNDDSKDDPTDSDVIHHVGQSAPKPRKPNGSAGDHADFARPQA